MVRGSFPGMKPGTILGHEAVGIVEEAGSGVRNFKRGDRVVVPSTIACGYCSYCRAGYFSQCDHANPNGPQAGTSFYGGPADTGPFNGLQAEMARVPFANVNLVKIPDDIDDDQAILLSDIVPTGYFGADLAEIKDGDIIAVFGCGPVGQFAIASSKLMGAGRVIAVDAIPSRLEMARVQGAEIINFNDENPVETIRQLTGGIGVDRAIEAVGIDAESASRSKSNGSGNGGSLSATAKRAGEKIKEAVSGDGSEWKPGSSPAQALEWAVGALAKAGTLAIIGVYPPTFQTFPIGKAMNRNLTMKMGNCNHRRYMEELIELVSTGVLRPEKVLTQREPITSAIDAYTTFNERQPGWIKVKLEPASSSAAEARV